MTTFAFSVRSKIRPRKKMTLPFLFFSPSKVKRCRLLIQFVSDLFYLSRLEGSDFLRWAASGYQCPDAVLVLASESRELPENANVLRRANTGDQGPFDFNPFHHRCLFWIATASYHRCTLLHSTSMLHSRKPEGILLSQS
jgi:hypothetical protein